MVFEGVYMRYKVGWVVLKRYEKGLGYEGCIKVQEGLVMDRRT